MLRERDALLPGVTTLARLVAAERDATTGRLWETLESLLTDRQRRVLDQLLEAPPGARVSGLEWWRKVSAIAGLELAELRLEDVVPTRRLTELARYEMTAKATALRRHGGERRLAT